ncbi:DUF5959 family protein [Nocardiopsis changdeensis]|uniref:Uncharacterized protein n=1 Tax=Nocardiopsis changdeensis TaxID=2831969 RepID=A0ABX8BQU8_9ACTN|nr:MULTISPECIES: DUF5959 family protein [Nocardiopsis]QUX24123.1 hypothetical protein KGD84_07375 [Nocardiopsis changdeensis]QYX34518.1 hypothetical protein K1J57_16835 [Nocardiopsis sp. MT53]
MTERMNGREAVEDEVQKLELFLFADPVQSVAVEVVCGDPLVMGEERYYAASIVLRSDFVNGHARLMVSVKDLDDWERCLDTLRGEEGTAWPKGDRTAWLEVSPEDPLEVIVHDMPSTQITVRMPIDDTSDWGEENQRRLERVRHAIEP